MSFFALKALRGKATLEDMSAISLGIIFNDTFLLCFLLFFDENEAKVPLPVIVLGNGQNPILCKGVLMVGSKVTFKLPEKE